MARKNKNASKRYKGAAIVDPELQNILQKHLQKKSASKRKYWTARKIGSPCDVN